MVAMPLLGDAAAKVAKLEPLHTKASALQQRLTAERKETEGAFGAEERVQAEIIHEATAPVLEMEEEMAELQEHIDKADIDLRQMLSDSGVSGRMSNQA